MTAKIVVERKTLILSLRENSRGRFLKVTENNGKRYNTLIIPAPGLDEFKRLLADMTQAADEIQPGHYE